MNRAELNMLIDLALIVRRLAPPPEDHPCP